jgi:hypothetical protein
MADDAPAGALFGRELPRWLVYALLLGIYLTLRGYHSLDGDQAYRLPLLLHRQDPKLYAGDPFVEAFAAFNPHHGSILVLDLVTWPLGLSGGLFAVFVLTFAATCYGIDRLAQAIWPGSGTEVGLAAVGLVLAAKAGNIGTNHLFEAMVLDRLVALGLGWVALAEVVSNAASGRWRAPAAIALACVVHPSAGLQLALFLGASWVAWACLTRWTQVDWRMATLGTAGLAVAVVPGVLLNLAPGGSLVGGMPHDSFWLLSVELQSPQHMLPHMWRMPQWLAYGSYLALAGLALVERRGATAAGCNESPRAEDPPLWPAARARLVISLVLILAGLALAYFLIEVRRDLRVTVFQPFRMATVARGIALVLLAGYLLALWRRGGWLGRLRAVVIAIALAGDWLMVEVTAAELAVAGAAWLRTRLRLPAAWRHAEALVFLAMIARGLNFLGHHDTEYGHIPLLAALGVGALAGFAGRPRRMAPADLPTGFCAPATREIADVRAQNAQVATNVRGMSLRRFGGVLVLAWAVPLASFLACLLPADHPAAQSRLASSLVHRCRFTEIPCDDIERLALWCRAHTPEWARFIGPPGPKTFRLWSRRSLAFNRAGSPYHAAGLADWFARFQDHVDFHDSPAAFVRAYVNNRHGFESRYQALGDDKRAALALRQGASHVIAAARRRGDDAPDGVKGVDPFELLHVEGEYAVYRVRSAALVQRH